MSVRTFSHVGITVSDFNKAVRFYWDVLGCPLLSVMDAPPERVRTVFGVDAPAPRCKIGLIRVPGGSVLEIFAFDPQQPPVALAWNRVGVTHLAFNVSNLQQWHDHLVRKGVECVSGPQRTPRGVSIFYAKDFDGNLIELIEPGRKYYILNWLGPLIGWLLRRGKYQQYYSEGRG